LRGITPMFKKDGRDRQVREAWELQALGQATLVGMLRDELDDRLLVNGRDLASVLERERTEREAVAKLIDNWKES
jgi:hypothetical protein